MVLPPPARLLYEIASAEARAAQDPAIDTAHLILAAVRLCDFPLHNLLLGGAPDEVVAILKETKNASPPPFPMPMSIPKNFTAVCVSLHMKAACSVEAMHDDGALLRTKPDPEAIYISSRVESRRHACTKELCAAGNSPPVWRRGLAARFLTARFRRS